MRFRLLRSPRRQGWLKGFLMLALGLFLYSRLSNGTLYYYISERYVGFTIFAVVGLIGMGLAYQFGRPSEQETEQETTDDHSHGERAHHDAHEHAAGQGHHHALSWQGVLLVALPVILGLLVPARPLGVAALENREVNLTSEGSALPAAVRAANAKAGEDRNMLEWWRMVQASSDYSNVLGERARVVGFVYHDPQYPADYFTATRFVVSCCVADAAVVGLVVQWPETVALENDQWVEISGSFVPSTLENWRFPILVADSIVPVDVPQQPYLYP